ncbi:MAG: hypothetical protein WBB74_09035 [Gaiellaceae bacterium]
MRRLLWAVGALAAAAALAVAPGAVAGGSGNTTQAAINAYPKPVPRHHVARINFRSVAAIKHYLRSRGINPKTFVIQLGRRNYAGPNCPGRGWNCTRATRVVQFGGSNVGECTGQAPPGPASPQNCTIMQGSSGGNTARCSESSDAPDAQQLCDITQTSTTGANNASADQSIHNQLQGSTQDGQQRIRITQTSGSGANNATWSQTVHFSSQDHSGPTTETQDGHQFAIILQRSAAGNETSKGTQFEHFTADAHDGTIEQDQNTGSSPFTPTERDCHPDTSTFAASLIVEPNTCALVTQERPTAGSNTAGVLRSDINQMNHLQVNAHSDGDITQKQGTTDGGLDLGVEQHSTGVATNDNSQNEHFQANGATKANLKQFQHGPVGGNGSPDPNQGDNTSDRADFDQKSKLQANGTNQPTLDTLLIDDAALLANDQNALLNALAAPLPPIPLSEGGNVLEQDSFGGIHYSTTGNATGSTDFSTNTGHAKDTESGSNITIESECGVETSTCFSGPPG